MKLNNNNLAEFVGQIIEVFEDLLEEKGIDIPNEEKEESEDPAIIYGTDYGELQSGIEEILQHWGVINPLHIPPKKEPHKISDSELEEMAEKAVTLSGPTGYRAIMWEDENENHLICNIWKQNGSFVISVIDEIDDTAELFFTDTQDKQELVNVLKEITGTK